MDLITDIAVQCTRCRNYHKESERISVPANGVNHLVCPRCSCKSFYDLRPQVAWCWASGLIEIGDEDEIPDGGILVARGKKAFITGVLAALCRHGRGESAGKFLVPGVPEATSQDEAVDALSKWILWCAKNNGNKGRHGVEFITPGKALTA